MKKKKIIEPEIKIVDNPIINISKETLEKLKGKNNDIKKLLK